MLKLLPFLMIIPLLAHAEHRLEEAKINLYLTSAAINVLQDLVPLLPLQQSGRSDCYVVTAGNPDDDPHWIFDEIGAIKDSGRDVRPIDLAELSRETLQDAFDGCDVIWVGGGNTFYLLQEVRRSGFDEFVTEKVRDGTPYVGTSAGSIILAPNIEAVKFADDATQAPHLSSYDGLNLFPLVTFAHFDNPDFKGIYEPILRYALENDVAFVTLKEKQFIAVEDDHWKLIDSR